MNGLNNNPDKHHKFSAAFASGDFSDALEAAKLDLQENPHDVSSLTNMGTACFMLCDYDAAVKYYKEAYRFAPEKNYTLFNLANALYMQKKYSEAASLCRQILGRDSHHKEALSLLGYVLFDSQDTNGAETCFEKLCDAPEPSPWDMQMLSQCKQKLGDYESALHFGFKAVKLSGGEDAGHVNFGYTLYEIYLDSGMKIIKPWLQKWQNEYGKNPIVSYWFKSLTRDKKTLISDPCYVAKIFDYFADSFEDSLSALNYQVPAMIYRILRRRYWWKKTPRLRILDLGCGTGLCGKFLKKYAADKGLDGVDLSQKMLDKASAKNIYSRLVCQSISDFLPEQKMAYDLIVAADVLTYLGQLDSVFADVCSALSEGGCFLFSASCNFINDDDWFLYYSGRFLHSDSYLRATLGKSGFSKVKMQKKKLREEDGKPVWGWIISAWK